VWAINGATCTIRVQVEGAMRPDFTGPTADLPNASVGAPLCVRVEGTGAASYVLAEIRASVFANPGVPGTDERGSVQRGEFTPGIVPREITGEPECWWED